MNIDRIKLLIILLKEVREAKKGFDLESWESRCGTTACAVGYAAADRRFNEMGLTSSWGGSPILRVDDAEYLGWEACHQFFEIHRFVADHLFSEYCYPVKVGQIDQVIDRLERIVEGRARLDLLSKEILSRYKFDGTQFVVMDVVREIPELAQLIDSSMDYRPDNHIDSLFGLPRSVMKKMNEVSTLDQAVARLAFWSQKI